MAVRMTDCKHIEKLTTAGFVTEATSSEENSFARKQFCLVENRLEGISTTENTALESDRK